MHRKDMRRFKSSIQRHLILLLLLTASSLSQAQPAVNRPSLLHGIAQDSGVEDELRRVLGKRHASFEQNFQVAASPVRLGDGSIFVDGWRADHPDAHAAAVVIYEDGRVYVAYADQDGDRLISWEGGTDARRHPAILIWLRRFEEHAVESTAPLSRISPASDGEIMLPVDQDALRRVAISIWENAAATWEMNAAAGDVLEIVINEIMHCSAAIGVVPKPTGNGPGWSHVAKNAVQIVGHITGVSRDRRYK